MPSTVFVVLLALFAVVERGSAQNNDCPEPQGTDLEDVIALIIQAGDASGAPNITLLNSNVVCRAFGEQQGLLRGVSVVVEYTCTGHSDCQTDTVVEQIESGCPSGNWTNSVGGTTATDFIRSPLNGASLSTTAREDCSRCFSEQLASDAGVSTDPVTHCVECDSACEDEGLMSCYGTGAGDCCNFYHNLMCVDDCPSGYVFNSTFFCVCPEGLMGDNCDIDITCGELVEPANGDVDYSDSNMTFNSTATYSCDEGYTLTGNSQRICVGLNIWSGSEPTCTVVDCGALQAPANGAVMTNPGTNFTSIATYICDPGFFLEGEPTRTCPATGNWTGSQPTCSGCTANCVKCSRVTCEECEDGYKLENGVCSCPVSGCNRCDSDPTKCDECEGGTRVNEGKSACITGGGGGGGGGGGLSPGAIVAAVVTGGVVDILTVLVVVAVLGVLISRKKKNKESTGSTPEGDEDIEVDKNAAYTTVMQLSRTNKGGDDDIEVDVNAAYVTVTQVED